MARTSRPNRLRISWYTESASGSGPPRARRVPGRAQARHADGVDEIPVEVGATDEDGGPLLFGAGQDPGRGGGPGVEHGPRPGCEREQEGEVESQHGGEGPGHRAEVAGAEAEEAVADRVAGADDGAVGVDDGSPVRRVVDVGRLVGQRLLPD